MAGKINANEMRRLLGHPTAEVERRIEEKIAEVMNKLVENKAIMRPTIAYDLKGHTAGRAIGERLIRLNIDLLYDERYVDEMIDITLPHEIAHCVVAQWWPRASAHGLEWKMIMRRLGLPADRCHSMQTKPARVRNKPYNYYCDCRNHRVSATIHRRILQGRTYSCKQCGAQLRPVGI